MFGWFKKQIDWEMENYCLNLENRADSLKRRIAEAKLAHSKKLPDGRTEPTVDFHKEKTVAHTSNEMQSIREKLIGKSNPNFYKPKD